MISVIIPAYNCEKTIEDTVDSVLNQTRFDLIDEIIVVNDGSTDNTEKLIETKYEDTIVRLINKKNGGVSAARNIGIKNANSKWIALLDSDDVWMPEKIEKQWELIEKYPEIKFIGCNRNKENVHIGTKVDDNLYKLSFKQLLMKMWPHTSTALINKEVFHEVGFFNEQMRYAEDGELWSRIALKYPLYYISLSYEIAGGNKLPFGESGLSANLKGMYEGNVKNIINLLSDKNISLRFYMFLRLFYWAKYIRRIIITKYNEKR